MHAVARGAFLSSEMPREWSCFGAGFRQVAWSSLRGRFVHSLCLWSGRMPLVWAQWGSVKYSVKRSGDNFVRHSVNNSVKNNLMNGTLKNIMNNSMRELAENTVDSCLNKAVNNYKFKSVNNFMDLCWKSYCTTFVILVLR